MQRASHLLQGPTVVAEGGGKSMKGSTGVIAFHLSQEPSEQKKGAWKAHGAEKAESYLPPLRQLRREQVL